MLNQSYQKDNMCGLVLKRNIKMYFQKKMDLQIKDKDSGFMEVLMINVNPI